jgi:predicted ribosome quality control (RQC) complex YloA/Tae2 family protein
MRVEFNKTSFVIGRSAEENWKIISEADKEFHWVHAEGIPSSHIIIEIDEPLDIELQFACKLCHNRTKMKDSSFKFITTQVKNLKLGSKPGEVYFRDISKVKLLVLNQTMLVNNTNV